MIFELYHKLMKQPIQHLSSISKYNSSKKSPKFKKIKFLLHPQDRLLLLDIKSRSREASLLRRIVKEILDNISDDLRMS